MLSRRHYFLTSRVLGLVIATYAAVACSSSDSTSVSTEPDVDGVSQLQSVGPTKLAPPSGPRKHHRHFPIKRPGHGHGHHSCGTGGAGHGTGGAGGGTSVAIPLTIADDYVTDGSFSGYGFTFTYSSSGAPVTITPSCTDTGCTPQLTAPLCASGIISADVTYNSGAGLGFNLNQAQTTSDGSAPPALPATLTGNGLVVDFTNHANTQLTVQLSDGTNFWCYMLTGLAGPISIPWKSFNSACWDDSGAAFDPSANPVTSLDLVFPGDAMMVTEFNACLNGIATF